MNTAIPETPLKPGASHYLIPAAAGTYIARASIEDDGTVGRVHHEVIIAWAMQPSEAANGWFAEDFRPHPVTLCGLTPYELLEEDRGCFWAIQHPDGCMQVPNGVRFPSQADWLIWVGELAEQRAEADAQSAEVEEAIRQALGE